MSMKFSYRKYTIAILIVMAILLIVWDIFVAVNGSDNSTISDFVLSFARRHPILPFAIGVLCGHLCWPQRDLEPYTPQAPPKS